MASSAEPERKTVYSDDLRWRVVWLRLSREYSYRDIAKSLCVSLGTAHNVWSKFVSTGEVSAKKQPPRDSMRVLDHHNELLVIGLVLHQPDMYLREICQYILSTSGVSVSEPTLCRILRKHGLRSLGKKLGKKLSSVAPG